MNQKQQDDILYGEMEEDRLIDILNEKWNTNIKKLPSNHPLDFISGDGSFYIEIKARRNNYNKYPTTMIGYNKIKYAQYSNKKVFFLFSFNDGMYQYEYNKNDKLIKAPGGRWDRGRSEVTDYIYIPIEKLVKID